MTESATNSIPHGEGSDGATYHRPNVRALRPPQASRHFDLLDASEVDAQTNGPVWVIDGLLQEGVNMLFGASGSGKTFVALDMALHVAQEEPLWHGRRVTGGTVVYVAAEDPLGASTRRKAWRRYRDVPEGSDKGRLLLIQEPVRLSDPAEVEGSIAAIRGKKITPALIVFDTLARCIPGMDENSSGEMGMAIDALEHIRRETGAVAVLAVHHTGYSEKGRARGSSALQAAMQGIIQVTGKPDNGVTLTTDKQRNGKTLEPISLTFHEVVLPDGERMLTVTRGNEQARSERQPRRPRISRDEVLTVLKRAKVELSPSEVAAKLGAPNARKAIQNHLTRLMGTGQVVKGEVGYIHKR